MGLKGIIDRAIGKGNKPGANFIQITVTDGIEYKQLFLTREQAKELKEKLDLALNKDLDNITFHPRNSGPFNINASTITNAINNEPKLDHLTVREVNAFVRHNAINDGYTREVTENIFDSYQEFKEQTL